MEVLKNVKEERKINTYICIFVYTHTYVWENILSINSNIFENWENFGMLGSGLGVGTLDVNGTDEKTSLPVFRIVNAKVLSHSDSSLPSKGYFRPFIDGRTHHAFMFETVALHCQPSGLISRNNVPVYAHNYNNFRPKLIPLRGQIWLYPVYKQKQLNLKRKLINLFSRHQNHCIINQILKNSGATTKQVAYRIRNLTIRVGSTITGAQRRTQK